MQWMYSSEPDINRHQDFELKTANSVKLELDSDDHENSLSHNGPNINKQQSKLNIFCI